MRLVWLERFAIAIASLALAFVLIALMSGFFAGRDSAALAGSTTVGLRFADQGDTVLLPGYPLPTYDSSPPTSGPHASEPVLADGRRLNDNQILTSLALGNVVVVYGSPEPPAALVSLAGPFTPALAKLGDAVILAQRPGTSGLIALSWTRMLHVTKASDPLLQTFVAQRLGKGAPGAS